MEFATSIFLALGLAMDAFAVSLGVATGGQANDRRSKFRLSLHFGVFQSLMTILGWLAGSTIVRFIESFDHWVALVLLVYVGVNMIRSGLNPNLQVFNSNPTRGGTLMMLSVATSLDALAVGLSMAMLKASVFIPSLIIGVVTFGLSIFGLLAGTGLGKKFGKRVEILGGVILLIIGFRVLVSHMSS